MLASILSAVGTFINVISQLISATVVTAVVVPTLRTAIAVAIAVVFMILYVIFGGAKGAGFVGIVKMALLYVSMLACCALVLCRMEFAHLVKAVPKLSLFAGIGSSLLIMTIGLLQETP